jgi:hypothetical protein
MREIIIATESGVPVFTMERAVGNGRKVVLMRTGSATVMLLDETVHMLQPSDSSYWLRDPSGQEYQYARVNEGDTLNEIYDIAEIAHYLGAKTMIADTNQKNMARFERLLPEDVHDHVGTLADGITVLRK